MAKLALDEVAPTRPGWPNLPPFLDQNMCKSNWEAIPSNEFRRVTSKTISCLKPPPIATGDKSPNTLALKIHKCPGNPTRVLSILKDWNLPKKSLGRGLEWLDSEGDYVCSG